MKFLKTLALAAVAVAALARPATAQTLQDEIIRDLQTLAEKVVALAQAVPVSDYTHKVHPDVLSIGEEFMHIASSNFRFPEMLGEQAPEIPEDWARGNAEGIDQAAAAEALNASFSYLYDVVRGIDDLDAPVTVFGRQTDARGWLVVTTVHLHEHLGKLISASRSVGVVPPWSM